MKEVENQLNAMMESMLEDIIKEMAKDLDGPVKVANLSEEEMASLEELKQSYLEHPIGSHERKVSERLLLIAFGEDSDVLNFIKDDCAEEEPEAISPAEKAAENAVVDSFARLVSDKDDLLEKRNKLVESTFLESFDNLPIHHQKLIFDHVNAMDELGEVIELRISAMKSDIGMPEFDDILQDDAEDTIDW